MVGGDSEAAEAVAAESTAGAPARDSNSSTSGPGTCPLARELAAAREPARDSNSSTTGPGTCPLASAGEVAALTERPSTASSSDASTNFRFRRCLCCGAARASPRFGLTRGMLMTCLLEPLLTSYS